MKLTRKYFSKKQEEKKEKIAKDAAIGSSIIGAAGLGTSLGAKLKEEGFKKKIDQTIKDTQLAKGSITANKKASEVIEKLKGSKKLAKGISKKAGIVGLAGLGTSVAAGAVHRKVSKGKQTKEFSEKEKKEKLDAINTGLTLGGSAALGVGTGALTETSKKNRIKRRQQYRKGYKSGATESLAKSFLDQSGAMSKDPELAQKMSEYVEKEKRTIPRRAAEGARKLDKKILAKDKKTAKVALGISGGLFGARAIKGAIDKKKSKKD